MKNLLYFILVLLLPEIAMTQNLVIGSGFNFTVRSGTDIVVPGSVSNNGTIGDTGAIDVAGNWTNNGTSAIGSGTVTFDGSSSADTIAGSTATLFNNLTISNSAGVALSSVNASVSGTLDFTAGLVATGSDTLKLTSSGSVSGAGSTNYVNGNFRKTVSGVSSLTFEIGDGSVYAPVQLSFGSSTSGGLTASTTPGQAPNIGSSKVSSSNDVARYWSLGNSTLSGFGTVSATDKIG